MSVFRSPDQIAATLDGFVGVEGTPPDGGRSTRSRPSLRGFLSRRTVERVTLVGILVAAGVLYLWKLSRNGYGNLFYAAAVRSMTESWHNFFFGAFDPGGFITIDKPPLAFWVQAASATIFGFNSWSILAPQAVAGGAGVYVLYRVVDRQAGTLAALVAAAALTVTPIMVAVNRDNNPDAIMILLLLLAAWATQAALESGRLSRLALAGALIGLAFTTKMMAAYLVLPGLALAYGVGAAGSWKKKLSHLAGAGATMVVVSAAWMLTVDFVPKNKRPYVGGSTNDTVSSLVFGYNGIGRLTGTARNNGPRAAHTVRPINRPGLTGRSGTGMIFNHTVAGQIAWLIPFSVATLATGILAGRRRPGAGPPAGLIMWGGWSLTCWVVFSYSRGIFHPYYVSELAPGLAALTGIGVATLMGHTQGHSRWALVPIAGVVANLVLAVLILRRTPTWAPGLRPTMILIGLACGALLLATWAIRPGGAPARPLAAATAATVVLAILVAPAAYATTAVQRRAGADPSAGPLTTAARRQVSSPARTRRPAASSRAAATNDPAVFTRNGSLNPLLLSFLVHRQGSARYLVSVTGDGAAQTTIISTGRPVLPMGGFGGGDPTPTTAGLESLIGTGRLRFVIIAGRAHSRSLTARRNAWVERTCAPVKESIYGVPAAATSDTATVLYDCRGAGRPRSPGRPTRP